MSHECSPCLDWCLAFDNGQKQTFKCVTEGCAYNWCVNGDLQFLDLLRLAKQSQYLKMTFKESDYGV